VNPRKGADARGSTGTSIATVRAHHLARRRRDSSGPGRSARSAPTPSPPSSVAAILCAASRDDPARTRCSRLSRAGSRPYPDSGGHPDSWEGRSPFRTDDEPPDVLDLLSRRPRRLPCRDCDPSITRSPTGTSRFSARAGGACQNRPRRENYLRRAKTAAPTLGRRLDAAAVSRAHDVFYLSDAGQRHGGSVFRPSGTRSTSGSTRRSSSRRGPSWSSRPAPTGGSASTSHRCATFRGGEVASIDIESMRRLSAAPAVTYLAGRCRRTRLSSPMAVRGARGERTLVS
jgi:hypothetical protein